MEKLLIGAGALALATAYSASAAQIDKSAAFDFIAPGQQVTQDINSIRFNINGASIGSMQDLIVHEGGINVIDTEAAPDMAEAGQQIIAESEGSAADRDNLYRTVPAIDELARGRKEGNHGGLERTEQLNVEVPDNALRVSDTKTDLDMIVASGAEGAQKGLLTDLTYTATATGGIYSDSQAIKGTSAQAEGPLYMSSIVEFGLDVDGVTGEKAPGAKTFSS